MEASHRRNPIASQLYLHFLLIVFPIAFLVPVIRRVWVHTADLLFGRWYWKSFGPLHRATLARLRSLPPSGKSSARPASPIRYLCAWRLWKYDPRYRKLDGTEREVSFIEPLRLWWRGELDRYVGHPLLAGGTRRLPLPAALGDPADDLPTIVPPRAVGRGSG